MEPIVAKEYCIEHYSEYPFGMKRKEEMIALLNILQAGNENLDSMHDAVFNGYGLFMDIFGKWCSDKDLYKSILQFNFFIPEAEFVDWMIEKISDLKDDGYDDPSEIIRIWTEDDEPSDTKIIKTEDGYVVKIWY